MKRSVQVECKVKSLWQQFPFQIKDISTYRSELMGYSIVWIMMLHFTFTQIKPLGFIAQYGFAGVDIFMFVSGLGLFFSLDKDSNIFRFYHKRLLRIFPTYYIIGIPASIILFHDSLLTYLFRYTTVGYWFGSSFWEWYIPSIVIFYLLSPFIYRVIGKRWIILTLIVIILLTSYYLVDKENILDRLHFFTLYRSAAFILGMACGRWLKNGLSAKYFLAILVLGIPLFIPLFPLHHQCYNYKYLSLLFLLPTFLLVFTWMSKYLYLLNPVMASIGKSSLEIYLIQTIVFTAIIEGIITIPSIWHDLATILFIILCSLLGISTHWLIEKSRILK